MDNIIRVWLPPEARINERSRLHLEGGREGAGAGDAKNSGVGLGLEAGVGFIQLHS